MKRYHLVSLSLLLLLIAATSALAGEVQGLGALLDAAKGTRSADILSQIFGDFFTLGKGSETVLGQVFFYFNSGVASVAVLLLIYAGGVMVLETAHEGEFLGKLDSKWVPIRLVWGLAGVFPVVGGYCTAQLLLYFMAYCGIGLADLFAKPAVQFIIERASDQPIVTDVALSRDQTLQSLVKAQVCAIAYNSQYYDSAGQPLVDGAPPAFALHAGEVIRGASDFSAEGVPLVDYVVSYGGTGSGDYPTDYCGGVTIPADAGGEVGGVIGPLLTQQEVKKAHMTALSKMAADLWPISQTLYYQHKKPDPAALAGVRNGYNATIKQTVSRLVAQRAKTTQQILTESSPSASKPSWIELGFVFSKITRVAREIHDAVNVSPEPRQALANPDDVAAQRATYGLALANAFISQSDPGQRTAESADAAEGGGKLALLLRKIEFGAIQKALQAFVGGQEDLLTGMTNFGYTSFTALLAGLALMLGIGGALGILSTAVGNAVLAWASLILIAPLAFSLMCAFYLPMLPFIYWWGGIITWLIVVAEAFVAAPIWMVAHMELEGRGMGQRSEHGYLFILNLLFRPALMVLGLLFAWAISNVLGALLKHGLLLWYGSGSGNTASFPIGTTVAGIIQFFGVIILFGYLGMVTIKHSYSLITVLPDQALTFIGGHFQGIGGGIGHESHSTFAGVAGKVEGEASNATRQRFGGPPGGKITPKPGEN